jgi:hypothetical protein
MRPSAVASVLAVALLPIASAAQARAENQPNAPQRTTTAQPQQQTIAGAAAPGKSTSQDEAAKKKLEEQIAKELGASPGFSPPGAPAGAQAEQGTAPAQGSTGGNPLARLLLLPDISAIGSFAIAHDTYDVEALSPREGPFGPPDKPTPLFQELELGLQSVVDPYLRADIFIAFTPEGVDVEEAYATTLSLPAGLQVKAGTFFSPFGRQNQQHPHVWEFVDAPLARGRLLATEALAGPGVDVAWLAPLPWFAELHLAGQSTAPTEDDPERLTGVTRLVQYFPFGASTTLGVGLSAARRSEATGAFRDLGAVDAYLRWRPLRGRSYVTLQGELFARRFRDVEDAPAGTEKGGYAQLFWRQGPYYGLGVRYDEAPAAVEAGPGQERRYGALVAWLPSEFQRLRLQVSYDRRPGGEDGVEAILGFEIGIGAHGAHPF